MQEREFNEKHTELLEKYLDAELSSGEEKEFEQLLENSEEFRNEVGFQSAMIDSVRASGRAQRKEQMLADFRKTHTAQQPIQISWFSRNALKIAAAVTLLLVSSWVLYQQFYVSSAEEVFEKHFFAYDGAVITRGPEAGASANAYVAYSNRNYQVAIPLLQKMVENSPEDEVRLMLASAYLHESMLDQCRATLNQIDGKLNDLIQQNVAWYQALVDLKAGQIESSKQKLQSIAAQNKAFSPLAKKLLEEPLFE